MASLPYPCLRHNPPTDSTDFHRWDLYKELPQNSRNSQKLLRRVWHPCHTHAFGIILPQIPRIFTDVTYTKNSHRIHGIHRSFLGGMASLPYPRLRHNPPTDSTDFHRLDLYKELPQIPRIFTDGTYTKNSHRIHGIHRSLGAFIAV